MYIDLSYNFIGIYRIIVSFDRIEFHYLPVKKIFVSDHRIHLKSYLLQGKYYSLSLVTVDIDQPKFRDNFNYFIERKLIYEEGHETDTLFYLLNMSG